MSASSSQSHTAQTAPSAEKILHAAKAAASDLRYDIAHELIRVLVARGGDLGDEWETAAQLALRLEDAVCAVQAQKRFIARNPADIKRQVPLVSMLLRAGRADEALSLAERMLRKEPDNAYLTAQAAAIRFYKGETDCARALYERALHLNPNDHESWRQLAKLETFDSGSASVARMEDLARKLEMSGKTFEASAVLFALGDTHEKNGQIGRAFEHYSRAQNSVAACRPHPIEDETAFVQRICDVFGARFYAGLEQAREGHDSARPILIYSLPRSGSTLIERLLASHSEVAGGGELEAMRMACYPLGHYEHRELERFVRTHERDRAPGGAFGRIGDRYLNHVSEQFGKTGRVVDKALELPFLAGPALAALPRATHVWLERDPRDVALSIYKTPFPQRHDWSWSWEGIARRIVNIHALKRHFTTIFPDRVMGLNYERMVEDPERCTGVLLDHCALAREPVHERFHRQAEIVTTASHAQVRQPISTRSIGSWRRYEAQMQPFLEIFEKIWPEEWGDPYQAP